jgi:hypothetical protein
MPRVHVPLYVYPDQLIRDTWTRWSEQVLSQPQDAALRTARGFQDAISRVEGSVGANERTRAGELFDSGFLRGALVNSRDSGASRSSIPPGWELTVSGHDVHSRLGYCAYAVGKALGAPTISSKSSRALSVISAIMCLQAGFRYDDDWIGLVDLFDHVLASYPCPPGATESTWNRYVAAGMFCTMDEGPDSDSLVNLLVVSQPVTALKLVRAAAVDRLSPVELENKIRDGFPIASVTPPKDSLFWIGDPGVAEPRGLYTVAVTSGHQLLESGISLQREARRLGQPNPFSRLFEQREGMERDCVLESLATIFASTNRSREVWSAHMRTLYEGVLEGLQYLRQESGTGAIQRVFHAHGVAEGSRGTQLRVPKTSCVQKPATGDRLIVADVGYRVTDVREEGMDLVLAIEQA